MCRCGGQNDVVSDECETSLYCSLSPLASLCRSPSPSIRPHRCYGDGSEWHGLSRHTGAALWIISLGGAKTHRWERGSGKTFFFLSPPSFQHNRKLLFPPALCSFVPLIVSTHGSHVCSFDSVRGNFDTYWFTRLCVYVLNKKTERNILFASVMISKLQF